MRFYGLFLLTSLGFYERGRVKSPYASESKRLGWKQEGTDVEERKQKFFMAGEKLSLETQR